MSRSIYIHKICEISLVVKDCTHQLAEYLKTIYLSVEYRLHDKPDQTHQVAVQCNNELMDSMFSISLAQDMHLV